MGLPTDLKCEKVSQRLDLIETKTRHPQVPISVSQQSQELISPRRKGPTTAGLVRASSRATVRIVVAGIPVMGAAHSGVLVCTR